MSPDLCPNVARMTTLGSLMNAAGVIGDESGRYAPVVGGQSQGQLGGGGTGNECWCCTRIFCGLVACRKPATVILFAILCHLGFTALLGFVMEEAQPGFLRSLIFSRDPDLDALMKQKWPLHDLKSKAKNISFDTIAREHENLNFEGETRHHSGHDAHAQNHAKETRHLKFNGKEIDQEILNDSYDVAKNVLKDVVGPNSTKAEVISWRGMAGSVYLNEIKRRMGMEEEDITLHGTLPEEFCFPHGSQSQTKNGSSSPTPSPHGHEHERDHESCNKTSFYSQITGKCNNVLYPKRGSQFSPLRRILHPEPFSFITNMHEHLRFANEDPHGRIQHAKEDKQKIDSEASVILPLWGMFVLRDVLNVAETPGKCCGAEEQLPEQYAEGEEFTFNYARFFKNLSESNVCYVNIADHKKFRSGGKWRRECSALPPPAIYPSCNASDPRTPFNLATSFIDASNIYGSSHEMNEKLRTKKLGKLKVQQGKHGNKGQGLGFLPQIKMDNETCFYGPPVNANVSGFKCLLSGDPRIHENSFITSLSTIFVRQHNWIAFWLHKYNHHWDDERLFHEARRIHIAQLQHITYNEYLPSLLGNDLLRMSGISTGIDDFYNLYDPEVDPTPSTAFAYAKELLLYSMLGSKGKMIFKSGKREQEYWFGQGTLWYRPEMIRGRRINIESLMKGFVTSHASQAGLTFSQKLRSLHLKFANKTLDLPEILFERSQSLEVSRYMEYRKICGLQPLLEMKDYNRSWDADALNILTKSYKHLEEVDLLTGLLAEKPIPSGRVGPTTACILIDQFLRIKKGDRFWYEGDINFHHFTPEQLESIRETTLARIICDNTEESLYEIQRRPMLLPNGTSNPVIPCKSRELPNLKFELWKDKEIKEDGMMLNEMEEDGQRK